MGRLKIVYFSQTESDLLTAYRRGEDVKDIILSGLASKEKERGGYTDFDDATVKKMKNRAMISIGG